MSQTIAIFGNLRNGWAVGSTIPFYTREGVILKTTDGGINWTSQFIGSPPYSYYLGSVYFIDQNIGWVTGGPFTWGGGSGEILKTIDGGENWFSCWSGETPVGSLFFIDHSLGWVVGTSGTILKTTDGGANWVTQNTGTGQASLTSIYFTDQYNGWVVGGGGIIRNTTDGGDNWISQTSLTGYPLGSVHFVNENIGWAVGGGVILKTTTGGITYIEEKEFAEIFDNYFLSQNYPNPFNPTTTIEFTLPQSGYVTLKIYNILGEEVATLFSDRLTVGKYKYDWDASGLASGVYLYGLDTRNHREVRKMILMK